MTGLARSRVFVLAIIPISHRWASRTFEIRCCFTPAEVVDCMGLKATAKVLMNICFLELCSLAFGGDRILFMRERDRF